jgi:hypothetical protein
MWHSITNRVRPFHLLHRHHRVNDSEPIGTGLHDGGGAGSRLDLPNTAGGNLSRKTSRRDIPGANTGYTAGNASRQCYTYPNLGPILNPAVLRP